MLIQPQAQGYSAMLPVSGNLVVVFREEQQALHLLYTVNEINWEFGLESLAVADLNFKLVTVLFCLASAMGLFLDH